MLVSSSHHSCFSYVWTNTYWSHSAQKLPRTLWTSANLMMMFLIFLLQFIYSFDGFSAAEHETLCTSTACFTLNMDRVSFEVAHQKCVYSGGYLMVVRHREEENVLHSLLSQIQRQRQDRALTFWIGLKLHKGNCVLRDQPLRGFRWVSGVEDSQYSNWQKEPTPTCIEERCVNINYASAGQNLLKWAAGPCKSEAFYACAFYFKGMCKPLVLLGPGKINYTTPFSEKPQRIEMKLFPLGTFAEIICSDQKSHYSVCMGEDDEYRWNDPGPFCKMAKQNCAIINGGCEHFCHQDADEVRCSCKKGYDLDEDGLSCRIKNMCGVDTCEHRCVMGESGYSCKCPHGFRLDENQRSCTDIDECQSHACEDHLCINTRGSYKCMCKDGYEMVSGKCGDIDECVQSKCQHTCVNSVGSYSCYCNKGFSLSEDGHSCTDINECVSSHCQFACVNTVGSFLCTCPEGFHLETDGSYCVPDVPETSADSSDDPADQETQDTVTQALIRTSIELQHQSPRTDAPLPDLVNLTHVDHQGNTSFTTSFANTINTKVIICVFGSVIPLLVLVTVTLAIAIFRCSRSKKEVKKNTTADGYCWVSSGLDPRLEKLYESILTDDL